MVIGFRPSFQDIERLLFEIFEHAVGDAGEQVDYITIRHKQVPNWRHYMATDLLERWPLAWEEFERRLVAGPASGLVDPRSPLKGN